MSGKHFLPHTEQDRKEMMDTIGISSMEDLFQNIPASVRLNRPLAIPQGLSEPEMVQHLKAYARKNISFEQAVCFLGAGMYDHFIPAVVPHLAGRSEFYTAYTQYQPEISQGGLEALWEYQTYICELTGMDAANASLYDGATAAAEAMMMSCQITKKNTVLVSEGVHPLYLEVLKTYAKDLGFIVQILPTKAGVTCQQELMQELKEQAACLIVQTPNFWGQIEPMAELETSVHAAGGLLVAVVNPISLGLLQEPGSYDADIAVGEGQPLGIPVNFGGPCLGFMAVKNKYLRNMPGRVVGQTIDVDGQVGFVLTLQAREQHIRRGKASSNICSNEGLCALTAAIYLSSLGRTGFRQVAEACYYKAHYLAEQLAVIPGFSLEHEGAFFHEFVLNLPQEAKSVNKQLLEKGFIGGLDLGIWFPQRKQQMLLCVTEKRTKAEIDALVEAMKAVTA